MFFLFIFDLFKSFTVSCRQCIVASCFVSSLKISIFYLVCLIHACLMLLLIWLDLCLWCCFLYVYVSCLFGFFLLLSFELSKYFLKHYFNFLKEVKLTNKTMFLDYFLIGCCLLPPGNPNVRSFFPNCLNNWSHGWAVSPYT